MTLLLCPSRMSCSGQGKRILGQKSSEVSLWLSYPIFSLHPFNRCYKTGTLAVKIGKRHQWIIHKHNLDERKGGKIGCDKYLHSLVRSQMKPMRSVQKKSFQLASCINPAQSSPASWPWLQLSGWPGFHLLSIQRDMYKYLNTKMLQNVNWISIIY